MITLDDSPHSYFDYVTTAEEELQLIMDENGYDIDEAIGFLLSELEVRFVRHPNECTS